MKLLTIAIFVMCTTAAFAKPTAKCQKIFDNHYTLEQLDKLSNEEITLYLEDIIDCEQKGPLPSDKEPWSVYLKRITLDSDITGVLAVAHRRMTSFLIENDLVTKFFAADKNGIVITSGNDLIPPEGIVACPSNGNYALFCLIPPAVTECQLQSWADYGKTVCGVTGNFTGPAGSCRMSHNDMYCTDVNGEYNVLVYKGSEYKYEDHNSVTY